MCNWGESITYTDIASYHRLWILASRGLWIFGTAWSHFATTPHISLTHSPEPNARRRSLQLRPQSPNQVAGLGSAGESFASGDELKMMQMGLKRFTKQEALNTTLLRRELTGLLKG